MLLNTMSLASFPGMSWSRHTLLVLWIQESPRNTVLFLFTRRLGRFLGGPGLDQLDTIIITEALAYGCTGQQLAISGPNLPIAPVRLAGTEEQKKKYLGMMAAEPIIASFCVTEPGAGSDVGGVKTKVHLHV